MKRNLAALLLAMMLILCGCGSKNESAAAEEPAAEPTVEETVPATIPEDGNPDDVTCKGSYTAQGDSNAVVAASGTGELTNEQLQVWYWAEVARYQQENREVAPDFDRPLDVQPCEIDASVNSWQQYFLKQALSSWHTAQALVQHSVEIPVPTEEAYQPNLANTEKYVTGMPAGEVLYGYYPHYRPNSMHQAYLDTLPQTLADLAKEKGYASTAAMAQDAFGTGEEAVQTFADTYNLAYMYFTHLSHYVEPTQEELDAYYAEHAGDFTDREKLVDFRQILLIPEENEESGWTVTVAADGTVTAPEEAWAACEAEAQTMLDHWQRKNQGTEAAFGNTAHFQSQDTGMGKDGGRYLGIRQGELTDVLDAWCFDAARQSGDTAIVRSAYSVHILYFSGTRETAQVEAEAAYYTQAQQAIIAEAEAMFPMAVQYDRIVLQEAAATVSSSEMLYPDVAHERFPEVPLYLQQDYPNTMYGGELLRRGGCGITSFAMLASYMMDDELTPPEMCDLYGRYNTPNGTDGALFNVEPAIMGFYLIEKTYDNRLAKAALEEGHLVISVQHPGYWTTAGHYIVCERMNENGQIQVRDSNIYNFARWPAAGHKEDQHKWGNIIANGSGFWIYDYKVTRVDGCSRCGNPDGLTKNLLHTDYVCSKCDTALLRRNTYMN